MIGKYSQLIFTEEQIKKHLHLQVMARLNPKKLNIPEGWTPRNQIERFVWMNLVMDWPIEKVIKKYPNVSVNFVNRAMGTQ